MRFINPFPSIPHLRNKEPLRIERDHRAEDLEAYLAQSRTKTRLTTTMVQSRTAVALLIAAAAIMLVRIGYLQITKGQTYRAFAERNRVRLEPIPAPRGVVFDREQKPLLVNTPDFTLMVTPSDLPENREERNAIAQQLLNVYGALEPEKVRSTIIEDPALSSQPIPLAERIPYEEAVRLTTAVSRLPGITLEVRTTRAYPEAATAAHLLGYVGKPNEEELQKNNDLISSSTLGRMGIELFYDTLLRGKDGVREVERDNLNKELSVIASRDAVPGKNLVLSIDRGLQNVLSVSLNETVSRLQSPGGAAVALDPRTGEVRALVSAPSFDPNLLTQGRNPEEIAKILTDQKHPLFFRAVSGTYSTGSTIKPVIAAAALTEGIIQERTTIPSTGGIQVGPNFFPDWKAGGHGMTDLRKALAESVNSYFYYIGGGVNGFQGLGVDRIVDYLARFGLGSTLGIDLSNEASGFIPTRAWRSGPTAPRWYLGDTYHLSIGQGYVNTTPLQVAAYTAAIANGGTLYRPRLVTQILSGDGKIEKTTEPEALASPASPQTLAPVRAGMHEAVLTGSAQSLSDLSVSVAAKTGTAQFGVKGQTHAWLTAFAPYEQPELVVTVIVEAGGEGHATALPVAKRALQWYFQKKD